jgi:malate dehydrogenase (oxaloacetate-decarboxylating)
VQPTSAQFSLTLRVRIDHRPGMLGRVATAIGQAGGTIGDVELVEFDRRHTLRDMTVDAGDEEHERRIVDAVRAVDGAQVVDWTDRTLGMHVGGKLEVALRHPLRTADDLSMAYTPGVARVCGAIAADPDRAFQYTIKRNTVAVVSDGTAVLGLGDIGPAAAMPVMEARRCCSRSSPGSTPSRSASTPRRPTRSLRPSKSIAPGFGGINLGIPSAIDRAVAPAVAGAVAREARRSGWAEAGAGEFGYAEGETGEFRAVRS